MNILFLMLLSCNKLDMINKPIDRRTLFCSKEYVDKLTVNKSLQESKELIDNNELSKFELDQSLFYNAMKGNIEILKLLKEKGVDINALSNSKSNLISIYISGSRKDSLSKIINNTKAILNLGINLENIRDDTLMWFINRVFDKDDLDLFKEEIKEVIDLFITRGASTTKRDALYDALYYVIKAGREDVWLAKFLIDKGFKDNQRLLSTAVKIKNEKARMINVELLLEEKNRLNLEIEMTFNNFFTIDSFNKPLMDLLAKYYNHKSNLIPNCRTLDAFNFALDNIKIDRKEFAYSQFNYYLWCLLKYTSNLDKTMEPLDITIKRIIYAMELAKGLETGLDVRCLDVMKGIFFPDLLDWYHPFTLIRYVADMEQNINYIKYIGKLDTLYPSLEEKYIDVSWYFISKIQLSADVDIKEKQLDLIFKILNYLKKDELANNLRKLPKDMLFHIKQL